MSDHGIRRDLFATEAESFIAIGLHLSKKGLPVPKIFLHDSFSGLVFMEDLGDRNLQSEILNTKSVKKIIERYKNVIDLLIKTSFEGGSGFDLSWTYQTPYYSADLIIEKECRYFVEAFVGGFLKKSASSDDFADEFNKLASSALENRVQGFMHRDMQSRNIMIRNDRIFFIDFQGGRIGPLQYDLASLLIDPYVGLPSEVRFELACYCAEKAAPAAGMNEEDFLRCFRYCTITRNLQILGAFGYLSKVKGKSFFENYIPAALKNLKETFDSLEGRAFPKLKSLIDNLL
jgi:aminoglycoside/choline kinase family phosphotransferase